MFCFHCLVSEQIQTVGEALARIYIYSSIDFSVPCTITIGKESLSDMWYNKTKLAAFDQSTYT